MRWGKQINQRLSRHIASELTASIDLLGDMALLNSCGMKVSV
jgi:hypothetical protein